MALLPDAGTLRIHVYYGFAGFAFASAETLKSARSEEKVMGSETPYWDSLRTKWYEYALKVVTIFVGIVFSPVLILLYLIMSARAAFEQLADEDAMRG